MNNYFTLRRANRLRVKLLNSKSQEQIREVIRYLRRTSWDECGVELIYSDLIDMAVQANENGQELFNVIEDAKTFAEEVKSSLKTLRTGDYFWFVAPLYFFFGWFGAFRYGFCCRLGLFLFFLIARQHGSATKTNAETRAL